MTKENLFTEEFKAFLQQIMPNFEERIKHIDPNNDAEMDQIRKEVNDLINQHYNLTGDDALVTVPSSVIPKTAERSLEDQLDKNSEDFDTDESWTED